MTVRFPSDRHVRMEGRESPRTEFEFLLACTRYFLAPERPLPAVPPLDWDVLLQQARKHCLTQVLFWTLRRLPDGVVPDEAMQKFRARFDAGVARSALLSGELARLLDAFDAAGIEVVCLKGATLAMAFYGGLLRTSSDIDLLVRRADVVRAARLLEQQGYDLRSSLPGPVDVSWRSARDGELHFHRGERDLSVDLHWDILPPYFPPPFHTDHLWAASRPMRWGRVDARVLAPEHQLLFLSGHGAKHLWRRAGWLCDVARVIQVERTIDWVNVFEQAERAGTARMLSVTLLLVKNLLGVKCAHSIDARISADAAALSTAVTVQQELAADAPNPPGVLESARGNWRHLRTSAHRLRYLWGTFASPTEAEYDALRLPQRLFWLYYPFRAMRLVKKYAASLGISLLRRLSYPNP